MTSDRREMIDLKDPARRAMIDLKDPARRAMISKLNKGSVCVRDYQTEHCLNLIQILKKHRGYLDTSKMGLGKTYITIAVAMYYDSPLLVIGPKGAEAVWRSAVKETGAKMVEFITKDALRSRKGYQPKHGYLVRDDSGRGTVFTVTKKFSNFLNGGGFIVIDECQAIRNSTSDQHKAAKALINHLVYEGGTSRFALLSASPLTEVSQIISFLRTIGYIRSKKLYTKDRSGSIVLKGLEELITVCKSMNAPRTEKIVESVRYYNARTTKELVRDLFSGVVKHYISSAVVPPKINIRVDQKNGYYKINKANRKAFLDSLKDMEVVARYERGTSSETNGAFSRACIVKNNIITQRRKTELLKAPIFSRLARTTLMEQSTSKVIIAVHYLDTLDTLKESLKEFNPIVLQGSVKGKDPKTGEERRDMLVREFQTNPKRRLIIAIVKVIAVSISLHDTIGNEPRFMYLSPSYELLQMYQATGRIVRDGKETKSDATIRFVYVKDGELEMEIYDALTRKSKTLKDSLVRADDIILPGDYEDYKEGI